MLAYRKKKKKKKNTAHACSREKKIQTSPYSFLARTCRKRGCITLIIHKCLSSLCSTNIIRELSPPPPPGPYSLDIDGPYSLGSWVRGGGGGGGVTVFPTVPRTVMPMTPAIVIAKLPELSQRSIHRQSLSHTLFCRLGYELDRK